MNTMKIQTGTRNVKQTVRRFTKEQKNQIIHSIDNRPSNVTKSEMFERYGFSRTGGLYYVWKKKGYGRVPMTEKMSSVMYEGTTRSTNVPMNTISIQRIVVEVNINTVDGLFRTLKEINKINGVKSVSV